MMTLHISQGSLRECSLPALLVQLNSAKFDGCLFIRQPEVERHFYYVGGALVYLETDRNEESLGYYLVDEKVITDEERQDFLLAAIGSGRDLPVELAEAGRVAPTELFKHLRRNFEQQLLQAIAEVKGVFEVRPGVSLPPEVLTIKMDLGQIIFEGVLSFLPQAAVDTYFPLADDEVLLLATENVYQQWTQHEALRDTGLADLLQRQLPYRELTQQSGIKAPQLKRLLFALVCLGVLQRTGQGGDSLVVAVGAGDTKSALVNVHPHLAAEEGADRDAAWRQLNRLAEKYLRFRTQDYFQLFELRWTASEDQIEEAYIRFLVRYNLLHLDGHQHADTHRRSRELLLEAAKAFAVLSTPDLKRSYLRRIVRDRHRAYQEWEQNNRPASGDGLSEEDKQWCAEECCRVGFQFLHTGRFDAAFDMFQVAADLAPTHHAYQAFVGFSSYMDAPAENWQVGYTLVNDALKAEPTSEVLRLLKARMLVRHGDHAAATACLQEGLEIAPKSPALMNEMKNIEQGESSDETQKDEAH